MTEDAIEAFPEIARGLEIRGKRLRSRVFLPGHQPGLAENGLPGERYIAYHRRRARAVRRRLRIGAGAPGLARRGAAAAGYIRDLSASTSAM